MKIDSVRFKTITSKKRARKDVSGENFSLFDLSPVPPQMSTSPIQTPTGVAHVGPVTSRHAHNEPILIDYAESVLDDLHLLNLTLLGHGDSLEALLDLQQKLLEIPDLERSPKLSALIEMVELRGHVELAKRGLIK
jgi:hypothetical protein